MKKIILLLILFSWNNNLQGQSINSSDSTFHKTRKNSIYYQIGGIMIASLNYGRYFSISEKNGFVASCGFCVSSGEGYSLIPCEENFMIYIEGNYLLGGPKHFLELGYSYEFTEPLHQPRLGYRYQGEGGFLFRGALVYLTQNTKEFFYDEDSKRILFIGLSFGYCF